MSKLLSDIFTSMTLPSLESLVCDGETKLEREYEIYGTLPDLDVLRDNAKDVEHQEQWGNPIGECGNIRVRRTTVGDDTKYILTAKVKGADGNQENEIEISEDFYILFRSMIERGLNKTRYKYPVKGTGLVLEVDVFNDIECKPKSNIVKIDLEIGEDDDISGIRLPFKLEDVRVIKPGHKSEEDLEYVKKLFREEFDVINPDVKTKS